MRMKMKRKIRFLCFIHLEGEKVFEGDPLKIIEKKIEEFKERI